MPRTPLMLLLCLAAAGCAQPDIPIAVQGDKTGYVVTGTDYAFHPTEESAKAAAIAKVGAACPNGADVSTIQTTPSQVTFGYLTSTYTATVVCH